MKRNMGIGVLFLFVAVFLCGCSATELEDRCFPMMAVIDEQGEQVTFGYGFPQLSQKENTDMQESNVNAAVTMGTSLRSCVQQYDEQLEKRTDCNHMKVLVLGETLIENKESYEKVLSYLKQTELFPRNTYVCVTPDPDLLFALEDTLSCDLGSYLEEFLQNHESDRQIRLWNVGRLLDEQENHLLTVSLPYIEVKDNSILWTKQFFV